MNIDIKKQLEVKNKEIYMNKLNLDLDNNLEVLVLTIDNLLSFKINEVIRRVLEIEEDKEKQLQINEKFQKFIDCYRDNLMNLLDNKKNKLIDNIIKKDDFKNCKNNLENNYLILKDNLVEFSKLNIKKLENELKDDIKDEFKLQRLRDYLNNIFIINLNNKILDNIKNRDLILLNTFNETYLKYLELNKNTVGV